MSATKIVGDGMIGRACRMCFPDDMNVTFHAAGVSNSTAVDRRDFDRERERLIQSFDIKRTLVYFSTCLLGDVANANLPYVGHKHEMEQLVQRHHSWLILRLPNVAGRTTNPHTLLNYLFARISRSERFVLQGKARRNIIGVGEVVQTMEWLLNSGVRNEMVNVAAPQDHGIREIVAEFERLTGKPAVMDVAETGTSQPIDTSRIAGGPVDFGRDYLRRTLTRYYG